PAIEGGASVAGALERARRLAALRIEGDQPGSKGGPDLVAVIGDPVHMIGPGKRAILAHDFGRTRGCLRWFIASFAVHCLAPAVRLGTARQHKPTQTGARRGVTSSS